LGARQAIKKIVYTCLPCKLAKNPFGEKRESPMPADRVTASKPFLVNGIDFAGPLYLKGACLLKQCYITQFTCATIRAVKLELCSDITTVTFLLAFQRFIGRCGLSHTIYTDNAQTFRAANRELAELWAGPLGLQKTSPHCPVRYQVEVHCSQGGLVGRMV
jgi:hypothetical protein